MVNEFTGILCMNETDDYPKVGRMAVSTDGVFNITHTNEVCRVSNLFFGNQYVIVCVLAGKDEIIKMDDKVVNLRTMEFAMCVDEQAAADMNSMYGFHKVLLKPDEISPEILQHIIDSNLTNGDCIKIHIETKIKSIKKD